MPDKIIINVGRQFGSGGRNVAAILSEKLGIQLYDNELIIRAAEESGYSKDFFKEKDEKKSLFTLSNIFSSTNRFGITENYLNDNEVFRLQSDVIRKIAENGSAIFVGRASDYVLRDMKCLDVFICAPMDNRKARIAERKNISLEEAESLISKTDRQRKEYYDYFTFGSWGTASNYDLCLDSSILGIEGTADFIIDFAHRSGLLR